MGNIHVKLYEIRTNVQEEMPFKGISYLFIWSSGSPFVRRTGSI